MGYRLDLREGTEIEVECQGKTAKAVVKRRRGRRLHLWLEDQHQLMRCKRPPKPANKSA